MDGRFVSGIAVAWVLTGVELAVLMRRRVHHLPVWLALGSVLRPFAVPLALEYAEAAGAGVIAVGACGRGASRTLVGITAERLVGRSPVPVLVGRKVN